MPATATSNLARVICSAASWLDKRGVALYSTRYSVRSVQPSVLACTELVFAVGLYWWIAIYFDTQKHLWVSICIAPILLLRSPKSVVLGVRLFRRYTELYNPHLRDDPWHSWYFWLLVATAALFAGSLSYYVSIHWLASLDAWSRTGGSAILGWMVVNVGLMVAAAGAMGALAETTNVPRHILDSIRALMTFNMLVEVLGPVVAAASAGIVAAIVAAPSVTLFAMIFSALVMCLLVLIRVYVKFIGMSAAENHTFGVYGGDPWLILLAFLMFGIPAGYLAVAFSIRLLATLCYIGPGCSNLPINWKRTMFSVDCLTPPELVPGYNKVSRFNFRALTQRLRSQEHWTEEDYYNLVSATVYFVPAYIYRLTLKSTFWLYWPLAYISVDPHKDQDRPAVLMDKLSATPLAWVSALMAACSVGVFVVQNALMHVKALWPFMRVAFQFAAVEFLFQLDWKSQKPWVWLSLLSAITTLSLFIWAGQTRPEFKHGALDEIANARIQRTVGRMKRLARVGRLSSVLLIISLGVYFLLWRSPLQCVLNEHHLDHILGLFQRYYGDYMPEHPCG